jgi:hypothetical protein
LELRNGTGHTVQILGYSGEPYLRVTPDGVWSNTRSPAHWINETADGKTVPPADAGVDTTAAPHWVRVSSSPIVRWHDHRTHWMGLGRPAAVRKDPGQVRRLADWRVALVSGVTPVTVRGTLDYLPHPSTALWWIGIALLAMLTAAVAVLAARYPSGRLRPWVATGLGALLLAASAAELADDVGRALDTGAHQLGILTTLFVEQTAGPASALGAVAAAVLALRRRPAGIFATALAGGCLAVVGGLADIEVFAHAVAPVPWDGTLSRLAVAAVLGGGIGVAAGGWLVLRTERPGRLAPRTLAWDDDSPGPGRPNPGDRGPDDRGPDDPGPDDPGRAPLRALTLVPQPRRTVPDESKP